MTTQLRLYTIDEGSLSQFVEEWQKTVLPLRREHGFRIGSAWIIKEQNQFAWLISYDGDESWETKEKNYYASASRKELDPNPARLIARAEEYFAESVL